MGLAWAGSAGALARGKSRALRPDDAFRAASVTKNVTAAIAIELARQGLLALDEPLSDQLSPALLDRWSTLDALPHTTPRQLLARTSACPTTSARTRSWRGCAGAEPPLGSRRTRRPCSHVWTPSFAPAGLRLLGHRLRDHRDSRAGEAGQPLHEVYRGLVFDRSGWMEHGSRATNPLGPPRWQIATRASSTGRRSTRPWTGPEEDSSPHLRYGSFRTRAVVGIDRRLGRTL